MTNQKRAPFDGKDDVGSLTVREFCALQKISVSMFYKRRDIMPPTYNIGRGIRIAVPDAKIWLDAQKKTAHR